MSEPVVGTEQISKSELKRRLKQETKEKEKEEKQKPFAETKPAFNKDKKSQ
jgi:hypothetical protein